MRYHLYFEFTETEAQAKQVIADYEKRATPYQRKKYPGHFTPWVSPSESDPKHFVVWTSYGA